MDFKDFYKRLKLLLFSFFCVFQSLGLYAQSHVPNRGKLNVIFILADDLGWKDLGCYGSTFYQTPNIDALARDGMRFTRAYAAAPVCSPTRASILTGQYPVRTGVTDVINATGAREPGKWKRNTLLLPAPYSLKLPLSECTLAEVLRDAGYVTYMAGKWHLGPKGYWPQDQGFEINEGGWSAGMPSSYFSPYRNPELKNGPKGEYLPERLSKETVSFIKQHKDTSFFIYQSMYLVHTPLEARKKFIKEYKQKKERSGVHDMLGFGGEYDKVRLNQSDPVYAAMVKAMDNEVGRIIETLKKEGLYDHTLIIFTSDNGGLSTSEGWPTSNLPLRGGKGWMYEGGIREPLIIRLPGVTTPGSVSNAVITSPDFYPTILNILHIPVRPDQTIDGQVFTGAMEGRHQKKRTIYWHYPHYSNQGGGPASCIMEGNWKLIRWYGLNKDTYELYNVKKDIGEKEDLSSRYPKKVANMKKNLNKFLRSVSAKYPVPNPKFGK